MYLSKFPLSLVEEVKKCYPDVECKILVNELKTFYKTEEMHKCGMVKILAEMEKSNLVKSFTEIATLKVCFQL